MNKIEIKSSSKSFAQPGMDEKIFANFSLSISCGSRIAILGKSGIGKSTLLNMIAGVEEFEGEIEIPPKFLPLGLISQINNLLPWRSVEENIISGCLLSNTTVDKDLFCLLTEKLDLKRYSNYYPSQLSGGMNRKTLIARTLMIKPKMLMMDEPFSSLDFLQKISFVEFFDNYIKETGITMLIVTHDVEEALVLADRVIVLAGRPAKIVYDQPNSLRLNAVGPDHYLEIRETPQFMQASRNIWNAMGVK